jgi:hypothetical protein
MEGIQRFTAHAANNLAGMRRALLKKVGRGQEAFNSTWAEFEKRPETSAYEELVRYVPEPDRSAWYERAMATAERGDLGSFIELCVKAKETDRFAKRLECTCDCDLEGLSHYVTEPAAPVVAKKHASVVAKVFRALCMHTLKGAKSKYYAAAFGAVQNWPMTASQIMTQESRMPYLEVNEETQKRSGARGSHRQ